MTPRADDEHLSSPLQELRQLTAEPDWNAMERRLVDAFADPDRVASAQPAARLHWRWAAAAAAVVLAAAITYYSPAFSPSGRLGIVAPPAPPPSPVKPVVPITVEPSSGVPSPQPAPLQPPRRPRTAPVPRQSASIFDDFVALPGASALPEFESGRIVRVEVPLTVLPAYGFDLGSGASSAPVQADFLIGQDGVPRAIRLAATSQH
jgi:hypothetical protein